jgi:hypothetical protein
LPMSSDDSFQLATRETILPCGYAPRALHFAKDQSALFVGAKDGSIRGISVRSDEEDKKYQLFSVCGGSSSGVRSLSEWQRGWLWVARRGGRVELIDLQGPICAERALCLEQEEKDSARTVGWVDAERGFVSFHHSGTWIFPRLSLSQDNPEKTLKNAWAERHEIRFRSRPLSEIHFIAPLAGLAEHCFVLANRRGELFVWDGQRCGNVERRDLWEKGEEPAFINHISVFWSCSQESKQASGVFIATDRGVYLVYFEEKKLQHTRLALPGLGSVCMALTYARQEKDSSTCYLWAADSRGDSYLYRGDSSRDPERINFHLSGISHAGNQSMLAVSWYNEAERSLVVGQVRRNNEIVITEFSEIRQKREASDRRAQWLLSRGTQHAIRSFWQDFSDSEIRAVRKWPLEAQLSELFEVFAEESSTLKPLLEFLWDPSARTAWRILDEILQAADEVCETRACEAVQLWTLSLLGVINRAGGNLNDEQLEAAYLGIIRWLRDLRQRVSSSLGRRGASAKAGEEVLREIETSIGMVRKWGLFGDANSLRQNLVLPITVLRDQNQDDQKIDRLTYEVLLFDRGLDLQAEDRRGNLAGRNGWDVGGIDLGGRIFFVVSWHWGGIELFELIQRSQESEFIIHLRIVPSKQERSYRFEVLPGEAEKPIQRLQYGHSRAILLTKLSMGAEGEKAYLLTAPALPPSPDTERLMLWELVMQDELIASRGPHPSSLLSMPNSKESVYSLLDLGSGAGLAGLRSAGGKAACLLFQVSAADGALAFQRHDHYINKLGRGAGAAESSTRSENRVWSLARAEVTEAEEAEKVVHRIVLGCENGEILLLTLRSQDSTEALQDEWELVARMSSPVKALVCRRVEDLNALRIIAGCADGSVVAWQELPRPVKRGEDAGSRSRRFSSLWAFYEGEEIAGLHLVNIPEKDGANVPKVLAITRDEQCFLYNDLAAIAEVEEPGGRPSRIPVPGSRYGHFRRFRRAPPSAFASFLVPRDSLSEQGEVNGRVASLLTASKHGVVRFLSVHYPHFNTLRKAKYQAILALWWNTVKGNYQLRLVHAVYRSAPSIELILVRWLLDPAWPEHIGSKPTEIFDQPWKLPRNLRALLRLRKAREEGNESGVYESLLAALREAFRLGDLDLFQEICEMVLRSGNFDLFKSAGQPGDSRRGPTVKIYLQVLKAIEQSLPQWQGSTDRQENLARITVARNLVDGDTFLRILDAATKEEERKSNPHPFRDVLYHRIRNIRDLIVKRDARVSLEALRAANLSLQRLCKRLTQRRKNNLAAEVAWHNIFEPYFQELTAAAARVFRSPLELNDALAHAFARTFALTVCACPSAAMRIAAGMTETQLISDPGSQDDLCHLVQHQFLILEQLGIPVPRHAQELFRIASQPPEKGLSPLNDEWLQRQLWEQLGRENERDLRCLKRLYAVVGWFDDLEKKLSVRPEQLTAWWGELAGRLVEAQDSDLERLYGHSIDFWRWAIQRFVFALLKSPDWKTAAPSDLARRLVELAGVDQNEDRIQPRMVLLSHWIAIWATEMVDALRQRYDRACIFQPEYEIFNRLFDRLRRAAEAFPKCAAVRMNVVQGVLGHHLLEDLDEHILELQEIAHALDPYLVYRYREGRQADEPDAPVAESFARYLMERSERAESVPKNLRTLFSLLDPQINGNAPPSFFNLLMEFVDRDPCNRKLDLGEVGNIQIRSREEYLSLRLILNELDRNDEKHSIKNSHIDVRALQEPLTFIFDCSFQISLEEGEEFEEFRDRRGEGMTARLPRYNLARLWALRENKLQAPIEPRFDRSVPSTGMGLYMANFAASVVRWELQVTEVSRLVMQDMVLGHCVFHLTHCASGVNVGWDAK